MLHPYGSPHAVFLATQLLGGHNQRYGYLIWIGLVGYRRLTGITGGGMAMDRGGGVHMEAEAIIHLP